MNHRVHLLAACAIAALSLPAAAQSLKPGLWEVRSKMQGNAEMDQAMAEMHKQMAAMSPAERKQMEAMMAKQGVQMGPAPAGGGMATKICMTREMAERNDVPAMQGDCKTTSQSRSGNTWKMAFTCTNPPTTGQSQVTVTSPEAYTMKMTSTSTAAGKTEKLDMEGSGRWLGADCGNIKPMTPPKK